MDTVEKIVRTCLYEGYLLWPYRRSALKNTKRWTFGGIYPRALATVLGEPSRMQTQVLLGAGDRTDVEVRVRFLHLVDRQVVREGPDGPKPVADLTVDGQRYLSWQEATEREVVVPRAAAPAGGRLYRTGIDIPAGAEREPLLDGSGRRVGALVRTWRTLTGSVRIDAAPVADRVLRLTVRIDNDTPCPRSAADGRDARDKASAYAFLSTHIVLHSDAGRFVSLVDPPDRLREAATSCENQGTWPVLVSDARPPHDSGDGAHTMLSSPVTLYDFPAVSPESPGDLFDGTEIDQLLILGVLSLTDEEQREARACDPRAREILDRCAALGPEELAALHGTIRGFHPVVGGA